MRIRLKSTKVEGYSSAFNTHGLGEIIGNIGDDFDSWFIHDLEVLLPDGVWKDLSQAFEDRDVVPNNLNTYFGFPRDERARERGWND